MRSHKHGTRARKHGTYAILCAQASIYYALCVSGFGGRLNRLEETLIAADRGRPTDYFFVGGTHDNSVQLKSSRAAANIVFACQYGVMSTPGDNEFDSLQVEEYPMPTFTSTPDLVQEDIESQNSQRESGIQLSICVQPC